MFGAEGTGHVAFALWLIFSAGVIADRGTPAMLVRYIAKTHAPDREDPLTRALYPRFLWPAMGLLVCFLTYAILAWRVAQNGEPILWAFTGVTFLVYAHGAASIAAAQGLGRFTDAARRTVLGSLLQVPAIVIGAYFLGPAGAMLGHLVRHLPQGLGWRKYWSPGEVAPGTITSQMQRYGRNAWISGTINILVRTRVEFVFIGWFFSITEVGYFAAGMTFVSMIQQLTVFMLAALVPKFSQLQDRGDSSQFAVTYQRVLRWMCILLLPISFGGAAIMSDLVPLLFGSDFTPAIRTSAVLSLFMFAQSLSLIPFAALLAREKDQYHSMASALIGVFLIVLNLAVTPFFGGEGAAWVRGLVNFAALGLLFWFLDQRLELSPGLGRLMRVALAAGLCAAAAYGSLMVLQGAFGLIAAVTSGALVYLFSLRIFRAIPAEDIASLTASLRHALPGPLAKIAVAISVWLQAPQHND